MAKHIVIIGAGMAGLACAERLRARGLAATILEGSNRIGGRVGSDRKDGFLLDRGFQVMLTAYPASAQLLDYAKLQLSPYHSGASIFKNGKFHRLGDPTRHPADALPTMLAPIGTLADKLRVVRLRARVTSSSLERLLAHPETTTAAYLRRDGFSSSMLDGFFRPFLGGIFLENQLTTSSRKFEFVFRMFSQGAAALPAAGMQAIPDQLASRLPPGSIRLNQQVVGLEGRTLTLASGEHITADTVILATSPWSTQKLLNQPEMLTSPVACLYFSAKRTPVRGPWLVLNGEKRGPINNLSVPSQVQPGYAPQGRSLVSITVVDPVAATSPDLGKVVRSQLEDWFGPKVYSWQHLRTYRITQPIPHQQPPALQNLQQNPRLAEGLYRCGDSEWIASIEGAVRSGLQTADTID